MLHDDMPDSEFENILRKLEKGKTPKNHDSKQTSKISQSPSNEFIHPEPIRQPVSQKQETSQELNGRNSQARQKSHVLARQMFKGLQQKKIQQDRVQSNNFQQRENHQIPEQREKSKEARQQEIINKAYRLMIGKLKSNGASDEYIEVNKLRIREKVLTELGF